MLVIPSVSFAQVKEFDRMEMQYDKGNYHAVYRKSKKLLDNPEYDYSLLPEYYKSLSMFQLYRSNFWRFFHKDAFDQAKNIFLKVRYEDQGGKLFTAHQHEIQALKSDFQAFLEATRREGKTDLVEKSTTFIDEVLGKVPNHEASDTSHHTPYSENVKASAGSEKRREVVAFAEKYIGTPYRYAGETPAGFDCSGFAFYVMQNFGYTLPRSSSEQYSKAKHIKLEDAQPGDFVYFDSGSGVNHVGIVVENNNGNIKMVHSSTSSGVILTDISTSDYWSKRLKASGSYLE